MATRWLAPDIRATAGAEPLIGTGAEMICFGNEEYRRFGEAVRLTKLEVE